MLKDHYYRAIVADPPWKMRMGIKTRPQHYCRMEDYEIARLKLSYLAHDEGAWLFVWIPPCLQQRFWYNIFAAEWSAAGWKFSSRAFVWIKTRDNGTFHRGMGLTTRKNAEDCWLFRIGAPAHRCNVDELIVEPLREHSRKPDESFRRIERFCDGPYAEIFSREDRPGWDCWGYEKGKFNAASDRLESSIHMEPRA